MPVGTGEPNRGSSSSSRNSTSHEELGASSERREKADKGSRWGGRPEFVVGGRAWRVDQREERRHISRHLRVHFDRHLPQKALLAQKKGRLSRLFKRCQRDEEIKNRRCTWTAGRCRKQNVPQSGTQPPHQDQSSCAENLLQPADQQRSKLATSFVGVVRRRSPPSPLGFFAIEILTEGEVRQRPARAEVTTRPTQSRPALSYAFRRWPGVQKGLKKVRSKCLPCKG